MTERLRGEFLEQQPASDGQKLPLGASFQDGACYVNIWAPKLPSLRIVLAGSDRVIQTTVDAEGYHVAKISTPENRLRYSLELPTGTRIPDPASRFQPEGVHGPSERSISEFQWTDAAWRGKALRDYIIYELHIGTFTKEGTFDGAIAELPRLQELGITAIEIMPVAQFPGDRNWGYDGVGLYAVQNSYGGPDGLKRLVDAAHQAGIAVLLDVVYNHLGPEGNYLDLLGHYFTDHYRTPWGRALNFDQKYSHHVRRFFIENALMWLEEFHIDGLRLDAVHAIYDQSARHFLRDLREETQARAERVGRRFQLIAESDLNAKRFVEPHELCGYGLSAQWADDFHHCLHVLLTGEQCGYYSSYDGGLEQFAKVWKVGFAFTGEVAKYRKAIHGESTDGLSFRSFVVCTQNHDQVGNRMLGERLSALVNREQLKLAAAAVLLSPFTPLLFMGEEYGETRPFQYFASHTDGPLIEAVRKGRKEEFAEFFAVGEARDPFARETFENCKIQPDLSDPSKREMHDWYKELIALRSGRPCFTCAERHEMSVSTHGSVLMVRYETQRKMAILFNFSKEPADRPKCISGMELRLTSAKGRPANLPEGKLAPWSVELFEGA